MGAKLVEVANFYDYGNRLDAKDLGDYTINDLGMRAIGIASQLPNEFNKQGLSISPTGVAGLLGNFMVESPNLMANQKEWNSGPGYGLAQWTSRDRKAALFDYYNNPFAKGLSEQRKQVAFVPFEMVNYPGNAWGKTDIEKAMKALNGTNLTAAVRAGFDYERPGVGHFDRRNAEARNIFDLMGYGLKPDVWSTEKPFGGYLADRLPDNKVDEAPPESFVSGLLGIDEYNNPPPEVPVIGPYDFAKNFTFSPSMEQVQSILSDQYSNTVPGGGLFVPDNTYAPGPDLGGNLSSSVPSSDLTPSVTPYGFSEMDAGLAPGAAPGSYGSVAPEAPSVFGPSLADRLSDLGIPEAYGPDLGGNLTANPPSSDFRPSIDAYSFSSMSPGLAPGASPAAYAGSIPGGGSFAPSAPAAPASPSVFGPGLADRMSPALEYTPEETPGVFGPGLADRVAPSVASLPSLVGAPMPSMGVPSAPVAPSAPAVGAPATTIAGGGAQPSRAPGAAPVDYTAGYYVDPLTRQGYFDGETVGNINAISPNYAVDPLTGAAYNPSGGAPSSPSSFAPSGIIGGLLGAIGGGTIGGIPGAIGGGYMGYNAGNAIGNALSNVTGLLGGSGDASGGGGFGGWGETNSGGALGDSHAGGGWGGQDSYR